MERVAFLKSLQTLQTTKKIDNYFTDNEPEVQRILKSWLYRQWARMKEWHYKKKLTMQWLYRQRARMVEAGKVNGEEEQEVRFENYQNY